MTPLLVATDLSARSERAVRRAFALAEKTGADVTVACIVDADLPADMAGQMKATAEQRLRTYCQSISEHPFTSRVEVADPLTRIHEIAVEIDAALIVLGVHRPRPLRDLLSGTTMTRLVRASTRPVLLVRDPVDKDYGSVVCGIDLSPSCVAAARAAATLAPDAPITTFYAVHVPFRGFLTPAGTEDELRPFLEQAAQQLDDWWQGAGLPSQCQRPEPMAAAVIEALQRTIAETKPDLLAVGAHGRPTFSPTYLGSFTSELLKNPPCDVLVVRR